jgi:hypothetical protein
VCSPNDCSKFNLGSQNDCCRKDMNYVSGLLLYSNDLSQRNKMKITNGEIRHSLYLMTCRNEATMKKEKGERRRMKEMKKAGVKLPPDSVIRAVVQSIPCYRPGIR